MIVMNVKMVVFACMFQEVICLKCYFGEIPWHVNSLLNCETTVRVAKCYQLIPMCMQMMIHQIM